MRKLLEVQKIHITLMIVSIILIFIAGFRPIGLDDDSLNYVQMLHSTSNSFVEKEPFFWLIIIANKLLFNSDAQTFFVIFAALGVSIKVIAIKRLSLLPIFSVVTYVSLYFVLHEMTQIRVGVAAAIFLLALSDLKNENFKNYNTKIFIACLFHYSAIIAFFIYYIRDVKINKPVYFALPIIGIFIALMSGDSLSVIDFVASTLPTVLGGKIQLYVALIGEGQFDQIKIFNFYYVSLVFLYYVMLFNSQKFESKFDIVLLKIFGLMIFTFFALSSIPVLSFRVSEFFGVVLIILIPHFSLIFKEKEIVSSLIFIWLLVYFYGVMILQNLNF